MLARLRSAFGRHPRVRAHYLHRYQRRRDAHPPTPVRSIAICYYLPLNSPKIRHWNDGFVRAVDVLRRYYPEVDMLNFAERLPPRAELDAYDFVLAKSAFQWSVTDHLYRIGLRTRRGICVSGHSVGIPYRQLYFFDVVYHQTYTYLPHVEDHPLTFHAYGINTSVMHPPSRPVAKTIDYLGVGTLRAYKNLTDLERFPGRRVVVGECVDAEGQRIRHRLLAAGIEYVDYMGADRLRQLYWTARRVVLSSTLNGGGERVLLEARSCGTPVLLTRPNAKLEELARSPIYDGEYYGQQLHAGIQHLCD